MKLIGRGGMGAVYLARQPALDRLVALKILPSEFDEDPAFAARFMREAQALAALNHPNIVTLYDFGEQDDLCYITMEYVEGADLAELLDYGGITASEALKIIPQICESLQYAHDKGVIHRDIKPSNILIDSKGTAKLTDFGLAKFVDPDALNNYTLTETNSILGTPAYMAPEQREAGDVDHRSDIYSLGVVLYELLTNRLPQGNVDTPSDTNPGCPRHVNRVVFRAMEANPDSRYQSVEKIREDLINPTWYHVHCSTLKRLLLVFGILLFIGISAVLISQQREIRSKNQVLALYENDPGAITERLRQQIEKRAEEVKASHSGDWRELEEINQATLQQLEQIEELITSVKTGLAGNPDPIFAEAARLLASEDQGTIEALKFLEKSRPEIVSKIDRLLVAEDVSEERQREALRPILLEAEIHQKKFEWDNAIEDYSFVVANAPNWWKARILLGSLHRSLANWDLAKEHFSFALEISESYEEKITSRLNLALLLNERGEANQARLLLREALKLTETHLPADHILAAQVVSGLGDNLVSQGKFEGAETLFREVLKKNERTLGRHHPITLGSIKRLAHRLQDRAEFTEAEKLYREVLQSQKSTLGPQHPYTLDAQACLGYSYMGQGRFADAEPLFRDAMEKGTVILGDKHQNVLPWLNNLGWSLHRQGKFKEAEPILRQVVEFTRKTWGVNHPNVLIGLGNLGSNLEASGQYQEADSIFREVLAANEKIWGREHPTTLSSIINIANRLQARGNYIESEKLYREVLESRTRALGPEHVDTLDAKACLGYCFMGQRKYAKAEPFFREAVQKGTIALGEQHPSMLTWLNNLGWSLHQQGKFKEAEPILRNVVIIARKVLGDQHPNLISSLQNLTATLDALGKQGESETFLREIVHICKMRFGSDHLQTERSIVDLARNIWHQDRLAEAEELYLEIYKLSKKNYGADSRETLKAMNNLAVLQRDQEKYSEAEELIQQVVKTRERLFGRSDPDTLVSIGSLGILWSQMEKYREAESVLKEAFEGLDELGKNTQYDAAKLKIQRELKECREKLGGGQ
ncbi:MAG: tetratricopeptide repeat protein [Verrucomicrobiales bacterium]|nr:tetratricopeptide repeat protein [Verrucomicrobiales bacterium]